MTVLGLVPARGGSIRVPGKNLADVGGRSLVERAVEGALAARLVDRVVVSTDDEAIASVARAAGAEVPFLRPASLATATAGDLEVIRHALAELDGAEPDAVALLRPTAPFRRVGTIDLVVGRLLAEPDHVAIRTVRRLLGVDHPAWALREVDGHVGPYVPGTRLVEAPRSQDLPRAVGLAGVVDAYRTSALAHVDSLLEVPFAVEEVDELEAVDVDTLHDLFVARALAAAGADRVVGTAGRSPRLVAP